MDQVTATMSGRAAKAAAALCRDAAAKHRKSAAGVQNEMNKLGYETKAEWFEEAAAALNGEGPAESPDGD